ncbi:MAG: putative Ig domain-containing protein, partial [Chloroflexota bacterium]
ADLLRGANIWVRPSSTVTYVESGLPKGLKLVNGKLVATKPGTYSVTIKVKSAKGIVRMRTIKIKVA